MSDRWTPARMIQILELIEVDLTAGNVAPKHRIAWALSRVRAALAKARGQA